MKNANRILASVGSVVILGVFGAHAAAAGSLQITNCSSAKIWIRTFNSDDKALFIPYAEGCVQPSKAASFGCATNSCYMAIKSGQCSPGGGDLKGPMKSRSYTYYSEHSLGQGTSCN